MQESRVIIYEHITGKLTEHYWEVDEKEMLYLHSDLAKWVSAEFTIGLWAPLPPLLP